MKLKNLFVALLGAAALGATQVYATDLESGEWYVRLVLKTDSEASNSEELVDRYNLLGQLNNTSTGYDSRDLPELGQTWPGTYLSVIFYHPEWNADKETFNTDFHPIAPDVGDEWTFEVRSDDPSRDLSLTWKGRQAKLKNMVLVDLEDNKVIPAVVDGVKQVYHFRMSSVVRQFTWRLLTRKEYKAFLASGTLPPSPEPAAQPVAAAMAADKNAANVRSVARPQASNQRPSSNWLPLNWGQGEGQGYHAEEVPAGLPADPFAD